MGLHQRTRYWSGQDTKRQNRDEESRDRQRREVKDRVGQGKTEQDW